MLLLYAPMRLIDYLADSNLTQARFAARIGAHAPDLSRWLDGVRTMPAGRCPQIELATEGRVTCEELRPDVHWIRVPDPDWPHPQGRPAIDVAAPALAPSNAA